MPKVRLKVRMAGENVHPDTIKASDLAALIVDIEKAIEETAEAQGIAIPDQALVSVVAIESSSATPVFAIDTAVDVGLGGFTDAIAHEQYSKLPRKAWECAEKISKLAAKRGMTVEFIPEEGSRAVRAMISPERPVPSPTTPTAEGTTTIYGRCVRVGGVEPKVEIQLYDGTRLSVNVSQENAKRLAQRLYDDVGMEGIATWDTSTWKIERFRVTRICGYDPSSLSDAFKELARVANGRWNDVDASEYVKSLRDGPESNP